jgi:cytochrome c5
MSWLRRILFVLILGIAGLAFAGSATKPPKAEASSSSTSSTSSTALEQQWRIEGEKRYRSNCGRCHQPPHKFRPGTMAMAIRHMRVRAMLIDDDMKYVLYYMTH